MYQFIKSPMNYVGGKFDLLPQIMPSFPTKINKFVDLFAGGLNVGINVNANTIYANDQMSPLIDLYKLFQSTKINDLLPKIRDRIFLFDLSDANYDGFLSLRKEYNNSKSALDLFLLVCYSFHNQIRFNNKGEFNMPFGKDRSSFNDTIELNLIRFCKALQSKNIVFSSYDFVKFPFECIGSEDVVYCDPPYLITDATYNSGWTQKEDNDLMGLLDDLNKSGIMFAMSNVFTHKGSTNEALVEWIKKYYTTYLDKSYGNCNYHIKDKTQITTEVLITNYEWHCPKCEYAELF